MVNGLLIWILIPILLIIGIYLLKNPKSKISKPVSKISKIIIWIFLIIGILAIIYSVMILFSFSGLG